MTENYNNAVTGYWIIWSNEHRAYWRPDRKGYTKNVNEAGLYGFGEAVSICVGSGFDRAKFNELLPNETMIPAAQRDRWIK